MEYLLIACQCALAIILLLAAAGKILDPVPFRDSLRLTFRIEGLALIFATLVPTAELCLMFGLFLAPPHLLAGAFGLVTALFGLFTLWLAHIYRRGLHIACSCFGVGGAAIGRRTFLRNAAFMVIALAGCYLSFRTRSTLLPSLWLFTSVGALALVIMLLRAFVLAKPELVLSLANIPNQS